MLLEELALKKTLNVDFHNHGQTGNEFRNKKSLLAEGFSSLSDLLQRVHDSKLDIIYLTDTADN